MKIIVDAMGGDNAPQAPVMGAVQANREYGVDIILVGRGEAILKVLEENGIQELPAGVVKRVLKNARPETRRLINQFLKYPEQSVGSIMTAEFIDLKGTMTAAEAIRRIRRLGGDCESIYTCYVTDGRRVLDGVVTLRELLLAPDNAPVRTLMEPNVITVRTTDDQELAVRALMRYDFLSLPVVDQEDRLVGVVTVDDVMDVMEEEATEDFQRMAAMAPSEKSYLKTGVFALAKNRILWLLVLMLSLIHI